MTITITELSDSFSCIFLPGGMKSHPGFRILFRHFSAFAVCCVCSFDMADDWASFVAIQSVLAVSGCENWEQFITMANNTEPFDCFFSSLAQHTFLLWYLITLHCYNGPCPLTLAEKYLEWQRRNIIRFTWPHSYASFISQLSVCMMCCCSEATGVVKTKEAKKKKKTTWNIVRNANSVFYSHHNIMHTHNVK